MASATGERYRVARLSCAAPSTNTPQAKATKIAANFCESSPAGIARMAVRGFAASIRASAMRLKAMAADRAEIMQSTIQPSLAAVGMPPAASMAAHKANGSAKIECSHLIISSVVLMLVRRGTEYFSSCSSEIPKRSEGSLLHNSLMGWQRVPENAIFDHMDLSLRSRLRKI